MTRLDGRGGNDSDMSIRLRAALAAAVVVCLAVIFKLDQSTGSAPFQHLYYLPIVAAGLTMPRYAGPAVGLAAVVLYHLANPLLLESRYRESDIVQIALFVGIGVVTAKLADDRRQLQQLSVTDDLTGLYNLRGFEAKLTPIIRAAQEANSPVTLAVLDVDRLKSLNDTHGHRAGADAVRTVGRLVDACLPDAAFACRFGGDEFVIALPGMDLAAATDTVEALRRSVHSAEPVLSGMPFPAGTLSVSIGLACRSRFNGPPQPADVNLDPAEPLFRAADRALYVAKAAGRNQIRAEILDAVNPS